MNSQDRVNILMVDDQPGKLLSYEAILSQLSENLIKAHSANEALECLLKNDVAVVVIDVCMFGAPPAAPPVLTRRRSLCEQQTAAHEHKKKNRERSKKRSFGHVPSS